MKKCDVVRWWKKFSEENYKEGDDEEEFYFSLIIVKEEDDLLSLINKEDMELYLLGNIICKFFNIFIGLCLC